MLSKVILAPRDLLVNTAEAQRMSLFFDRIMLWPLDEAEVAQDVAARVAQDIEYLREHKVVLTCGLDMPALFTFKQADGTEFNPFATTRADVMFPVPVLGNATRTVGTGAKPGQLIRAIAAQLAVDDLPVVAHVAPAELPAAASQAGAVELVLNKVPLPPENMPWEDFIQFRADAEHMAKLRALRIWLRNQAMATKPLSHVGDELEDLLHDYRKYMDIMHKKHGEGVLSAIVTAAGEALANVAALNLGAAASSLFSIRSHSLALSEAELSAPGREVSYIVVAQSEVQRRSYTK